jgi:hypothetical protein
MHPAPLSARIMLLAIVIVLPCSLRAHAAAAKHCDNHHFVGVFSDCDLVLLKSWNVTPVAPSYVPQGFVGSLKLDSANKKYDITYTGPNGAYFIFEGGEHVSLGQPEEKSKRHNIFSGLNNLIHPKSASTTQPEEEADPNQLDVAAPSLVIGPAHFKPDSATCATGVSERGLNNTKYALRGCNSSPEVLKDELVRVYRSAAQVPAH